MYADHSRRRLRPVWVLSVLGMAGVLAAAMLSAAPPAAAQSEPLDPSRLFELVKPAVFMVQANLEGQVAIPTPELNDDAIENLKSHLAEKMDAGDLSQGEAREQMYLEVIRNHTDYVVYNDPVRTVEVSVSWMGTGWFITPDGYAITNVHVADPPEDELKNMVASEALDALLGEDMELFLNYWADDIVNGLGNDDLESTQRMLVDFYINTMEITGIKKTVLAAMGVTIPGLAVTEKGLPVEIVDVGETSPGKDIAILKVAGENFQTVELGDSSTMKPGATVYAIGYPAVATFHPYLTDNSSIEPSFTKGIISAKKEMPGGWHVYQMDAAISGGNSGGPSFNDDGQVIGINTFGSVDQSSGEFVQGMNFCIPVEVAMEFIKRNNITPEAGVVNKLWAEALELLDAGKRKDAAGKLRRLNDIAPGHPYVSELLAEIEKQAAEGEGGIGLGDAGPSWLLSILVVAGVIIVALLVVIIVLLTRRRAPVAAAAPVATPPPAAPVATPAPAPAPPVETQPPAEVPAAAPEELSVPAPADQPAEEPSQQPPPADAPPPPVS